MFFFFFLWLPKGRRGDAEPPDVLKSQPADTRLTKKNPFQRALSRNSKKEREGGSSPIPPQSKQPSVSTSAPDANAANWTLMDSSVEQREEVNSFSFDFTQYETPRGLEPAWWSDGAPGCWGLTHCTVSLQFLRAVGVFSQMSPLHPDTLGVSFLFLSARQNGGQFRSLLFGCDSVICCWSSTRSTGGERTSS